MEMQPSARQMPDSIRIAGSITHLSADVCGAIALVGSHGGRAVALDALSRRVGALIVHDAGVGREDAGVAALEILQEYQVPCAAVSHRSARIGDADDMLVRGLISHANECSRLLGVEAGLKVRSALECLEGAVLEVPATGGVPTAEEGFRTIQISDKSRRQRGIFALDSASSIKPAHDGAIVITGSHGGLPGGADENVIKAPVFLAAFNDAGIGIDDAGISRLPVLDRIGIAAVTVDAMSARIGDGISTLLTGVISRANERACDLGARVGQFLLPLVEETNRLE